MSFSRAAMERTIYEIYLFDIFLSWLTSMSRGEQQ